MQCSECGIDNGVYEKLCEQIEQLEKENEALKFLRDELFERNAQYVRATETSFAGLRRIRDSIASDPKFGYESVKQIAAEALKLSEVK